MPRRGSYCLLRERDQHPTDATRRRPARSGEGASLGREGLGDAARWAAGVRGLETRRVRDQRAAECGREGARRGRHGAGGAIPVRKTLPRRTPRENAPRNNDGSGDWGVVTEKVRVPGCYMDAVS